MPLDLAPDALDLDPREVAARFAWAADRGQPNWVWPDVPVAGWRDSLRAIEQVLRVRLAPEPGIAELQAPAGTAILGVAAFTSGTGGLLGRWIESEDLKADDDIAALLRLHLWHGRRRWQRMAAALAETLDLLAAAGIPCVLLKGAHTATAVFPEPGTRPMSDLDLLVEPDVFPAAEAVLQREGYVQNDRLRVQDPPHSHWIPPGSPRTMPALHLMHEAAPFEVNLHAGVSFHLIGSRAFRLDLPAAAAQVSAGPAQVLALPWLLFHLAAHASLQTPNLTLIRLTEIVLVARSGMDWGAFRDLLAQSDAAARVYPALVLSSALAPDAIPAELLEEVAEAATPRLRRRFADAAPGDVQPAGVDWRDLLLWTEGPWERVRMVAGVLLHRMPDEPLARRWWRHLRVLLRRSFGRGGPDGRADTGG